MSGAASANPIVNTAGQYTLTVTNLVNGCTASDLSDVFQNIVVPNANAGIDPTINCISQPFINGSSSTANTSFSWSGPGAFTSNTSTSVVGIAGNYTLTVTDTINFCTSTDIVLVYDSTALPIVSAGADQTLTCAITTANLNATSSVPGSFFFWIGPGSFSSISSTITVSVSGAYIVSVTNPTTGCYTNDTVNVITGAGLPNSNPGLTDTITCNNSTSQLNGSSSSTGVSFDWTGPNGFTSSSATPTISDSGIYVLTVSFISTGCSSTSQVYIAMDTLSPNASITSSGNTISCDTTILSLTGASSNFGVNISWSNFAGAIVGNPINITASGTYSLTVTNGYTGCKNVQVFNVFANNTPPIISLSATADTLNCANTSTLLFLVLQH